MSALAARTARQVETFVREHGEPATVRRTPEASGGYSPDPTGEPAVLSVDAHAVVGDYDAHLVDQTTIRSGDAQLFVVTGSPWEPRVGRDRIEVDGEAFEVVHRRAHRLSGRVLVWEVQGRR